MAAVGAEQIRLIIERSRSWRGCAAWSGSDEGIGQWCFGARFDAEVPRQHQHASDDPIEDKAPETDYFKIAAPSEGGWSRN